MRKVLGVLFCVLASPAYASYGMVLGNFSDGAYGGERRITPVRYIRDDYEPRPRHHAKKLEPVHNITEKEKSVGKERSTAAISPNLTDEQYQNALITKVLIERAYAIRQAEGIPEWTCMAESGKQLLAHIEAEFGRVDIQTEGTCADRNIRGSGHKSQHAYGRAIDFHPGPRHSNAQVVKWLVAHREEGWVSGIMTYRDMDHIHVDAGPARFVALNH